MTIPVQEKLRARAYQPTTYKYQGVLCRMEFILRAIKVISLKYEYKTDL